MSHYEFWLFGDFGLAIAYGTSKADRKTDFPVLCIKKDWVENHSDWSCPVCDERYSEKGGKTIDHKLPRSQYPWLSMEFKNLWIIGRFCNEEKGDMHWYEYERYILLHHPNLYSGVRVARPTQLLQSLKC